MRDALKRLRKKITKIVKLSLTGLKSIHLSLGVDGMELKSFVLI